jgi:copper transport protein
MRNAARRVAARRGPVALAALVAALAVVPAAAGHAVLVSTVPGNDSVLERAPDRVALRFNEPVESAFGAVRVYDSAARRVDDADVSRPDEKTVDVGIDRVLGRGTYTVTWRVLSADSHPISGAFVFHVREPGANPAGIAAQVLEGGAPRSVTVLFGVVRFLDFALLLLVVGGAAALALVLREAPAQLRKRLLSVLAAAAAGLVGVALAGVVVQGAAAGGFGLRDAARWDTVTAVLETRFGKVWLAQALLALALAVLAVALRRRGGRVLSVAVLAVAIALVPIPSLSGHASVSGGVSLVSDVAHVAAAAVWTGGLGFLVLALAGAAGGRWPLAAQAVPRFSTLAVASVAVLILAGGVNAYEQVGAWRGFWDTTYGLLLLAKIALVVPLLALGALNNRYAVPRLRQGLATPPEQRRFLRTIGGELVLVLAVVAVTAVLVTEPPARATVAPTGPFATTVALGELEANVVVDPASAGTNAIHLYLTDRYGRPADVDELDVSASLPSRRVGPLRFQAHPLAPGHYVVHGAELALAGDWQLRLDARRGEFEALAATVSANIRKDS